MIVKYEDSRNFMLVVDNFCKVKVGAKDISERPHLGVTQPASILLIAPKQSPSYPCF